MLWTYLEALIATRRAEQSLVAGMGKGVLRQVKVIGKALVTRLATEWFRVIIVTPLVTG